MLDGGSTAIVKVVDGLAILSEKSWSRGIEGERWEQRAQDVQGSGLGRLKGSSAEPFSISSKCGKQELNVC